MNDEIPHDQCIQPRREERPDGIRWGAYDGLAFDIEGGVENDRYTGQAIECLDEFVIARIEGTADRL